MIDIDDPSPVIVFDRNSFLSRASLVELILFHVRLGTIVHVEDRKRSSDWFRYEVRTVAGGMQVVDSTGRQLGIFPSVEALVALAETVT